MSGIKQLAREAFLAIREEMDELSVADMKGFEAEVEQGAGIIERVFAGNPNDAAEICAEMAREAAMNLANCRSQGIFELGIIEGYESQVAALREAERRIRASCTMGGVSVFQPISRCAAK